MDRDFLIDLFADFGPVTIRRMFSGYGISVDGVNFALALRAGLYFRADEQNIPQFEAEGSGPFQYQQRKTAKTVTVNSYWQLPARLFDDSEELASWARAALAAAQRAALSKRPKGARRRRRLHRSGLRPRRSLRLKRNLRLKSRRHRRKEVLILRSVALRRVSKDGNEGARVHPSRRARSALLRMRAVI